MKTLVTGGQGFIGSHLVDKLADLGHEVVVVDDNSATCNGKFYTNSEAQYHKVTICDYDRMRPLFDEVGVVFHLAAESRIQPSILNPTYATQVNVAGTCNVLQCARDAGVDRVVYSSTSAGYGLKNEPPLKEDMPKDCLNPYSVTKCAGEELCIMYTDLFGLKTVSFRYFNVYGERQPLIGQYAPVVGLFMEQYRKGTPMTIVGDGLQRRDFTHVRDVVQANILAAFSENEAIFGQVFNVGTGKNHSVLELAQIIGGEYVHIPNRPGEAKNTLADNTKIKALLKWDSTVNFEEWIREQKL